MKKYFWASITMLLFITSEVVAIVGAAYDVPHSEVLFNVVTSFMAGWFFVDLLSYTLLGSSTKDTILTLQEEQLRLYHEHVMELHEMYQRHINRLIAAQQLDGARNAV